MISKPKDKACETLCQQLLALEAQVKVLDAKLEERKKVERAKWILVKSKAIEEEEAQRILINRSRASRKKLVEMAEIIISGDRILNPQK
ncbi:MAG: ANTAR domain-containing protein [Thermodesulfobacteriota bacterium]